MQRTAMLLYGVLCYAVFLASFLYGIAFLGNLVPGSIDDAPRSPLSMALAVDLALLVVFALQHSVMARPAFKRWWTQYVPEAAERSTYVLLSSVALLALFWCWQPLGGSIWNLQNPLAVGIAYSIFAIGWLTVLATTLLINHFDLFGLRQVWLYYQGRNYTSLRFVTPGPYRIVRHPLYVGWMIVFWATPVMTVSHLLFAGLCTAYILAAIYFEERDLVAAHGESYAAYRRSVPMLLPRLRKAKAATPMAELQTTP